MNGVEQVAKAPNLTKRGGVYWFRMRVPADLMADEGRAEIVFSLRTRDPREATSKWREEQGRWGAHFERLRLERQGRGGRDEALRQGRIELLSDQDIEALVADWLVSLPPSPLGEDAADPQEMISILEQDAADLATEHSPAGDAIPNVADRLLVKAGAKTEAQRRGSLTLLPRPAVDRRSRQYRYLTDLLRRALAERNAKARAALTGRAATVDVPAAKFEFTVTDWIERYRAARSREFGEESTSRKYNVLFSALSHALGADAPLADLRRDDFERVKAFLADVPANATKKFGQVGIAEAVRLGREIGAKRLAPGTINGHMQNLNAMLNWAVDQRYIAHNPAQRIRGVRAPEVERRRFEPEQLERLFRALARFRQSQPHRFWVPALAAFTGARAGELCQLYVEDVRKEQGVMCIHITEFDAQGRRAPDKHLKTKSSRRVIPIHPQLVEAGFLDFVAAQRRAGAKHLFPGLKAGPKRSKAHGFSKWFGEFKLGLGLTDPSLVFHSFRHGFRDACRMAGVPDETSFALGGWTASAQGFKYGEAAMVPLLNRAVRKLKFGKFDLAACLTDAPAL